MTSFVKDGPRTRTVQPALASRVDSRRDSHEAICSDLTAPTLNLVAAEHQPLLLTSVELASGSPDAVMNVVRRVRAAAGKPAGTGLKTRHHTLDLPFDESVSKTVPRHPHLPTLDMSKRHAPNCRTSIHATTSRCY
jgi:hypothetical protein